MFFKILTNFSQYATPCLSYNQNTKWLVTFLWAVYILFIMLHKNMLTVPYASPWYSALSHWAVYPSGLSDHAWLAPLRWLQNRKEKEKEKNLVIKCCTTPSKLWELNVQWIKLLHGSDVTISLRCVLFGFPRSYRTLIRHSKWTIFSTWKYHK